MRPGPCPHARGCDDKSVWPEYHRLRGVGAGPVPWRNCSAASMPRMWPSARN